MARKSKKYKMNNSNGYGWVILMIVIVIILITIPCVCSNRKRENLKADYAAMNTQDTTQCKTKSGSMIKPLNDICPGCTTKSSAPSPSPSKGGCKAVKTKPCPSFNNSTWTPKNGWDWAHFYSGTRKNGPQGEWIPYNSSQVGSKTTDVSPVPNGADPSCGSGDWATLTKCFKAYGTDAKNRYFSSYDGQTATSGTCQQYQDGHINLISDQTDDKNEGKVATVAHGAFGTTLLGAMCTTGKFDLSLLGEIPTGLVKSKDWTSSSQKYVDKIPKQTLQTSKNVPNAAWLGCTMTKFNVLKAQLGEMYDALNTGTSNSNYTKWEPYGFKRQNANGSNSVLIKLKVFKDAGIDLPTKANGQYDITNDGIAISWGHGLGKGGCGSVTLMQQGIGPHNVCSNGSVDCTTSGNTILNFQIGTRAWSGEFSDSDSKQGYISECMCGNDDSASCLQPIFKTLELKDFVKLLQKLPPAEYGSMSGGAGKCEYCAPGSGGDCQAVLQTKKNPNGPDTVPYLACYPGTPSSDGKSSTTCPGSTYVCDNTTGLAPGSARPSEKPPKPPSIAKACSGSGSIPTCASLCTQPGSTVAFSQGPGCSQVTGKSMAKGCDPGDGTKKWTVYCCKGSGPTPKPSPKPSPKPTPKSGPGTCECTSTNKSINCNTVAGQGICEKTASTEKGCVPLSGWGCDWVPKKPKQ